MATEAPLLLVTPAQRNAHAALELQFLHTITVVVRYETFPLLGPIVNPLFEANDKAALSINVVFQRSSHG